MQKWLGIMFFVFRVFVYVAFMSFSSGIKREICCVNANGCAVM